MAQIDEVRLWAIVTQRRRKAGKSQAQSVAIAMRLAGKPKKRKGK